MAAAHLLTGWVMSKWRENSEEESGDMLRGRAGQGRAMARYPSRYRANTDE